eukprot:scaffold1341_cov178-Amphora_coffeaeformis.AAC.30
MSSTASTITSPLYQRVDSAERGRHLVATRAISKGRLIFAERPLVALQSLDNQQQVKVCHCCKAFVGGPDYALQKRFQNPLEASTEEDDDDAEMPVTHTTTDDDVDDQTEEFCVVPCRHKCGHVYCSKECEQDAWLGFHQDLCTGLCESNEDPIVQFKVYAAETNEILLMVAEWWVAQHRCTDEEWRKRYTDFTMPCWWDVAVTSSLDQIGAFAEGVRIQESLRRVCSEAAELLNKALSSDIPPITPADVSQWIGACEQNSMGIRQRHALCRSVLEDADVRERRNAEIIRCLAEAGFIGDDGDDDDDENSNKADDNVDVDDENENEEGVEEAKMELDTEENSGMVVEQGANNTNGDATGNWDYSLEEIERYLAGLFIDEDSSVRDAAVDSARFRDTVGDDLDYIFPPLDGTAMYFTACKMNHSCEPNVIVLYKGRGWGRRHPLTAYCIAYRDIVEGEELTISYIENDDPLEKRQNDLSNYGFVCTCTKCEAQKNGTIPDTSQKETNDEMGNLFGEDEDEDDQGGEDMDNGAESDEKQLSLEQKVERLDSAVNHSQFASVPLSLQGKVSSFVLQRGKESSSEMDDEPTLNLWGYCESGMKERDFCLCKLGGCELEERLYSMLKKSSWPSTNYRGLYWCAGLSAALGLAHEGSFLDALRYLDKALILGLPRRHEHLSDFFDYVEQHGVELSTGPYTPRRCRVLPIFSLPEDRQRLERIGLSKPISHPVVEAPCNLTFELFNEQFVSKALPVVVRGFAKDWNCVNGWRDMGRFAGAHGHRLVPVEIGSMMHGNMDEKLVTLRTFIDEYMLPRKGGMVCSLKDSIEGVETIVYLAQHPLTDQIPLLKEELNPKPSLCGPSGPSHIYYWMGTGGTRTPLHYDTYENLFVQAVGAKYVRLYDQSETPCLYVNKSGYGLQGNMSDVNCESEDFRKHPLAENAKFREAPFLPRESMSSRVAQAPYMHIPGSLLKGAEDLHRPCLASRLAPSPSMAALTMKYIRLGGNMPIS